MKKIKLLFLPIIIILIILVIVGTITIAFFIKHPSVIMSYLIKGASRGVYVGCGNYKNNISLEYQNYNQTLVPYKLSYNFKRLILNEYVDYNFCSSPTYKSNSNLCKMTHIYIADNMSFEEHIDSIHFANDVHLTDGNITCSLNR